MDKTHSTWQHSGDCHYLLGAYFQKVVHHHHSTLSYGRHYIGLPQTVMLRSRRLSPKLEHISMRRIQKDGLRYFGRHLAGMHQS
ncbi:hypothetical protein CFRS1_v000676 [Colletotrichum fructicola]|nr:hypothetical protein CFRS1_v000676 [Colletotrichum fructicola]